jgi:hypothetical protein
MIASWPTYTFLKPLPAASLMMIWAASLPKYLSVTGRGWCAGRGGGGCKRGGGMGG